MSHCLKYFGRFFSKLPLNHFKLSKSFLPLGVNLIFETAKSLSDPNLMNYIYNHGTAFLNNRLEEGKAWLQRYWFSYNAYEPITKTILNFKKYSNIGINVGYKAH